MKIFTISDLHLSFSTDKPMDIFGDSWEGHWDKIIKDWSSKVGAEDVVLIAGDISWGMTLDEALIDFREIAKLPGQKIIIRGNHDYWWASYSKVKAALEPMGFMPLQNNCLRIADFLFCGSRGWTIADEGSAAEDKKIYDRELIRLEMSLSDMAKQRKEGDRVVGMLHYPPFPVTLADSGFTKLFSQFEVDKVVYGHLHGKSCRAVNYLKKGDVEYYLTSCDLVDNKLTQLY